MFETVLFRWIEIPGHPSLTVEMGLQVDPLTGILLGNVLLVVAVILVQGRRNRRRLHLPSTGLVLLSLFAAAMLLLSTNVLQLLLFWQMTALCGFLLSGSGRIDGISVTARRTLLLRLGMDLLLIPGLYLIWTTFGSLEIGEILGRGSLPSAKLAALLDPHQPPDLLAGNRVVLSVICLCLLAAAVGRCGLFPLFRRRDDLTGGSATVQALIQSAVVMPAGVHLIVRWQRLFAVAPVAQTLMMSLGGLTALLAAGIAVTQTVSRRRLVFVNTSLFGLMFAALGWGTRLGLLSAIGLLLLTTLVMAVVVLAVGDAPVLNENEHTIRTSDSSSTSVGRRRGIGTGLAPLVRLCRRRFDLDTIGTQLFVLPIHALAVVSRLIDRSLFGWLFPALCGGLPVVVAKTAEPLKSQPVKFNVISLVLSSAVLTALLLWLWR